MNYSAKMWLKLLVLLIGATSISAGGPTNIYDSGFEFIEYEEPISPLVDPYTGFNYRLPNNTFPLTYDIQLSTDIHIGEFGFDGRARIRFQVVEASSTITLNYRQMSIRNVTLFHGLGHVIEYNLNWSLNETLEHFIIWPSFPLGAGQQFSVEVEYNSTIRSDSLGFYRASYLNAQDETVWLASTQFQANEARQAFPW